MVGVVLPPPPPALVPEAWYVSTGWMPSRRCAQICMLIGPECSGRRLRTRSGSRLLGTCERKPNTVELCRCAGRQHLPIVWGVEGVVVEEFVMEIPSKVFAVVGSAVLSAVLFSAGAVSAAEGDPVAPEWLFGTDAADVTISKAGSGFSVSLPANERVTAFTDRPNRQTATMTLRQFANDWSAYGFDTDPPNAALLLETGSATRTSVVEMTSPRVRNGRVTFRLSPIDGYPTAAGHTHNRTLRPATYDHVALFIDDAAACADGGNCAVGDTGPGGGLVFYVDSAGQTAYEMAPKTWSGGSQDPKEKWCDVANPQVSTYAAFGMGAANTAAMTAVCASGAANSAQAYTGGGFTDWFLPSKAEIQVMGPSSKTSSFSLVNRVEYFSSSRMDNYEAWVYDTQLVDVTTDDPTLALYVRPIRMFSFSSS